MSKRVPGGAGKDSKENAAATPAAKVSITQRSGTAPSATLRSSMRSSASRCVVLHPDEAWSCD